MQDSNIHKNALVFDLPYISAALPGIGGQLRATPDHFIVEEVPLYHPSGEGQHLYVNLTKEALTTRDVQEKLADLFKLPNGAIGFAGMKDKYARTTQTFSLNVGHVDEGFVQDAFERAQVHLPVTVNWVKLHRNKLKLGHLLGNKFVVTITDLAGEGAAVQQQAEAIATVIRNRGLPNYYGPQRLGTHGSNVRRGLELILGHKQIRNRWVSNLLKASVQSYLCNRYLARRFDADYFDSLMVGDVAKKYDTGGLFEVEDLAAEQPRYEQKAISFTAPMYGPKMWAAQGPAGEFEAAVLHDEGLTIEQLGKARLNGTRRMGRLLLDDLVVEPVEIGLRLSFSLPKGAFATTVLREFMKVADDELATLPADDDEES